MNLVACILENKLPSDCFFAGNTRKFTINTFYGDNLPADIAGATVYFTLTDYVNPGLPVLPPKQAMLIDSGDGFFGAEVILEPRETAHLAGKYIYQFTLNDSTIAYVGQGEVTILKNYATDCLPL